MSADGAAYVEANLGVDLTGGDQFGGQAYVEANVGDFGVTSFVGRVYGMASPQRVGFGYVESNVTL